MAAEVAHAIDHADDDGTVTEIGHGAIVGVLLLNCLAHIADETVTAFACSCVPSTHNPD